PRPVRRRLARSSAAATGAQSAIFPQLTCGSAVRGHQLPAGGMGTNPTYPLKRTKCGAVSVQTRNSNTDRVRSAAVQEGSAPRLGGRAAKIQNGSVLNRRIHGRRGDAREDMWSMRTTRAAAAIAAITLFAGLSGFTYAPAPDAPCDPNAPGSCDKYKPG